MSLDGNTLVRYVELMTTGLDDVSKSQIKQISNKLKDGSIELVDAKNALSQMGQTSSVDGLLEKYADELSSSSVKKITKTADDYWKDIESTGWYTQNVPERIQGELRMRVSNILNSNPKTFDEFESVVKKAFSGITIPPSQLKKLNNFFELLKAKKGLTWKQTWNLASGSLKVSIIVVAVLTALGLYRKSSNMTLFGPLINSGKEEVSDIFKAGDEANAGSSDNSQPQETKPQETKPAKGKYD
jgi:hypothetical protein